ncbi:MAG: hypothetical protein PUE18_00065 [Firmicutes bacterium]|nr:hypothetical protein [Bacillota bacterium]
MASAKKKTPTWFLYGLIVIMMAVFAVQMMFPTNVGKLFDKSGKNTVEMTVTVVSKGNENISYTTDSEDTIDSFLNWAHKKKARSRSLADSISADRPDKTEYNFAIKAADGSYSAIVIDERGFVHLGAELYKVSGDVDSFMKELVKQLESWG